MLGSAQGAALRPPRRCFRPAAALPAPRAAPAITRTCGQGPGARARRSAAPRTAAPPTRFAQGVAASDKGRTPPCSPDFSRNLCTAW
uniref:FXYD domain-containing ion transport regulator 3 isoform X2 n=1 Tax=Macaca mulatta TaxID=9544 RepID=UPI0010A20A7B|nr:FXYD domain-containing ion transport regulator 3 isoform X2 [Macaca mulatta]